MTLENEVRETLITRAKEAAALRDFPVIAVDVVMLENRRCPRHRYANSGNNKYPQYARRNCSAGRSRDLKWRNPP